MAESLDKQTPGQHRVTTFFTETAMESISPATDRLEVVRHLIALGNVIKHSVESYVPAGNQRDVSDILVAGFGQIEDAVMQAFGLVIASDEERSALYQSGDALADYFLANQPNQDQVEGA